MARSLSWLTASTFGLELAGDAGHAGADDVAGLFVADDVGVGDEDALGRQDEAGAGGRALGHAHDHVDDGAFDAGDHRIAGLDGAGLARDDRLDLLRDGRCGVLVLDLLDGGARGDLIGRDVRRTADHREDHGDDHEGGEGLAPEVEAEGAFLARRQVAVEEGGHAEKAGDDGEGGAGERGERHGDEEAADRDQVEEQVGDDRRGQAAALVGGVREIQAEDGVEDQMNGLKPQVAKWAAAKLTEESAAAIGKAKCENHSPIFRMRLAPPTTPAASGRALDHRGYPARERLDRGQHEEGQAEAEQAEGDLLHRDGHREADAEEGRRGIGEARGDLIGAVLREHGHAPEAVQGLVGEALRPREQVEDGAQAYVEERADADEIEALLEAVADASLEAHRLAQRAADSSTVSFRFSCERVMRLTNAAFRPVWVILISPAETGTPSGAASFSEAPSKVWSAEALAASEDGTAAAGVFAGAGLRPIMAARRSPQVFFQRGRRPWGRWELRSVLGGGGADGDGREIGDGGLGGGDGGLDGDG